MNRWSHCLLGVLYRPRLVVNDRQGQAGSCGIGREEVPTVDGSLLSQSLCLSSKVMVPAALE